MPDPFEEFWRFATGLYAKPGVAPACIALQDQHGKDVLIALYGAWLGVSGRGRLDAAELARLEAETRPWREQVVRPLRRTRQALKGVAGAEELYARMKQIELDAERAEMRRLAAGAPEPAAGRAAAERRADASAALALYAPEPEAAPILAAVDDG
jgi:uncharacterized protein (TIGR02444 family)